MTTLTNNTGSKKVNITKDATGTYRALYCQVYQNEEQVLKAKDFKSLSKAENWAKQILN